MLMAYRLPLESEPKELSPGTAAENTTESCFTPLTTRMARTRPLPLSPKNYTPYITEAGLPRYTFGTTLIFTKVSFTQAPARRCTTPGDTGEIIRKGVVVGNDGPGSRIRSQE